MTKKEAFAREALRALQRYDEVGDLKPWERVHLQFVQEDIGRLLGLECNADEPAGMQDERHLSHNSGTCPVHEWVDEGDYALCHEREGVT